MNIKFNICSLKKSIYTNSINIIKSFCVLKKTNPVVINKELKLKSIIEDSTSTNKSNNKDKANLLATKKINKNNNLYSNKYTSIKTNDNLDTVKEEIYIEIYNYKYASFNAKFLFHGSMTYFSANSLFLLEEIINPIFGKSMHIYTLAGSIISSGLFIIYIKSLFNKTVQSIEYNKENNKIKINFIEFINKKNSITIHKSDIIEFNNSNLEKFFFFKVKDNKYKYYINIASNSYFKYNKIINDIFSIEHK